MSNKIKKELGLKSKGDLFVVSAPAGTGKTTLVTQLIKEYDCVVQSISCTTRPARIDEKDGVHYRFLTVNEFEAKIKNNEFLEYVKLYGDYYGTSRSWVNERLKSGKHVVLVIDTQGAMLLKGKVDATFIFIQPPSLQELKKRLLKRRTESDEVILRRLEWAKKEMELAVHYDYLITNDDIETAYLVLKSIFIAQEHSVKKEKTDGL
jgi:guanylate kinase